MVNKREDCSRVPSLATRSRVPSLATLRERERERERGFMKDAWVNNYIFK